MSLPRCVHQLRASGLFYPEALVDEVESGTDWRLEFSAEQVLYKLGLATFGYPARHSGPFRLLEVLGTEKIGSRS